jgi:hypothetical protein
MLICTNIQLQSKATRAAYRANDPVAALAVKSSAALSAGATDDTAFKITQRSRALLAVIIITPFAHKEMNAREHQITPLQIQTGFVTMTRKNPPLSIQQQEVIQTKANALVLCSAQLRKRRIT